MKCSDIWQAFQQHCPDSKVHGANMGPIWGRQEPHEPCYMGVAEPHGKIIMQKKTFFTPDMVASILHSTNMC